LPPVEGRQRPERGDEAADGDRVDPARADADRRHLRPELPRDPRAALGLRLRVVVGVDPGHDRRPGRVLPPEALALAGATLNACRTSSARTARSAPSTWTARRASRTRPPRAATAASASCSSCSRTTTPPRTPG